MQTHFAHSYCHILSHSHTFKGSACYSYCPFPITHMHRGQKWDIVYTSGEKLQCLVLRNFTEPVVFIIVNFHILQFLCNVIFFYLNLSPSFVCLFLPFWIPSFLFHFFLSFIISFFLLSKFFSYITIAAPNSRVTVEDERRYEKEKKD